MATIPQQGRRTDADIRRARRDKLSPAEQILALRERPGSSAKEISRLAKLV